MRMLTLILAVGLLGGYGCSREATSDVTVEFRLAQTEPGESLTEMHRPGSSEVFYVDGDVILSDADVVTATAVRTGNGPQIELVFTEDAAARFARVTEANIGRQMAIIVNGNFVSAPFIRAKISGGKAIIPWDSPFEDAQRIARGLTPR
jgi:SecD/SecF fusion protein